MPGMTDPTKPENTAMARLRHALERELQAGETVEWHGWQQGRIDPKLFLSYIFAVPWTAFSLAWTGIAAAAVQSVTQPGQFIEADARLEEIDKALQAFGPDFDYPSEVKARAGIIVMLGHDGLARFERGLVRAEDAVETRRPDPEAPEGWTEDGGGADDAPPAPEPEADDALAPLSERLVLDLTAHRTMGLRDAVQADVNAALATVVHALALQVFYPGYGVWTPLQLRLTTTGLERLAPGEGEQPVGQGRRMLDQRIDAAERHGVREQPGGCRHPRSRVVPAAQPDRQHRSGPVLLPGQQALRVAIQAGVEDLGDGVVAHEAASDPLGRRLLRPHPQRQRRQSAVQEIRTERVQDAAGDRPHPAQRRRGLVGTGDHAADDVTVSAEVLRRAVQ